MKKVSYFFSLAMICFALSGSNKVNAQGRGHQYGHDKNKNGQRDNDNRGRDRNDRNGNDKRDRDKDNRGHGNDNRGNDNDNRGKDWNYGSNNGHRNNDRHHDHHNNWERRSVRHYYHSHDRYCNHGTVVVRNYVRPRYIYYRDYDVYYDCQRSVYISYSGRSWTVSTMLPIGMRHVNMRSASRYEVDYYDDNLSGYLERNRPTCSRQYFGG